MRNPQNIAIPRAVPCSILPGDSNEYAYLWPATSRFIAEAAYGLYGLTITHHTMHLVQQLASAAIRSWGGVETASFSANTDDRSAMLTLVRTAMLSHNARLTLSFGEDGALPVFLATPVQDARTFALKTGQEVLDRAGLDLLTMRSRLEQAGGIR